ncbi:hypothetical protein JTE90_001945 [Oedothorax gibbosus]|uniref:Uncharacterized protein n=1 Tax=Oedothorax gibbosus TaxID=931172 RepID=A0AAV6VTV5_9ARAC|nr:hypothetical protein JTE90_001945 [Oedothorax gibbosus]
MFAKSYKLVKSRNRNEGKLQSHGHVISTNYTNISLKKNVQEEDIKPSETTISRFLHQSPRLNGLKHNLPLQSPNTKTLSSTIKTKYKVASTEEAAGSKVGIPKN